jgi:hypothetical protein
VGNGEEAKVVDHSSSARLGGPGGGATQPGGATDRVESASHPGLGALIAVVGVILFALSLLALPWVSQDGKDLQLADLGRAVSAVSEGEGALAAGPNFEAEFLESYAERLAVRLVLMVAVAVGFSTVVVPRSRAVRVLLGCSPAWIALPDAPPALLVCGVLGAIVTWRDPGRTMGPKVAAVLTVLAVGLMHGYALSIVFGDLDPAPDPAIGVGASVAGLVAMVVGIAVSMATAKSSQTMQVAPQHRRTTL